jgi:hypothetical protein
MRRCLECDEVYEDSENFCELDGQRLVVDPAFSARDVEINPTNFDSVQLRRESWFTGLVGVMAGIVLCSGVYVAYTLGSSEDPDSKDQQTPRYESRMQDPLPLTRTAPARIPEPEPEPTEASSPEPEVDPSPESSTASTVGQEGFKVAAHLNQGPVSTGQRRKDADDGDSNRTFVQMNDGTTFEVDAAWEDSKGIWYRRGGLVSFVERDRVKSISEVAPRPTPESEAKP